jgi:cytochrome c-type biogenesis protein CcmH
MFGFWVVIAILTLSASAFVFVPLIGSRPRSLSTALTIGAVIPVIALGLYYYGGSSEKLSQAITKEKNATYVKSAIAQYGSRQNIIFALRKQLEHLPANANQAKGWFILGKLYFNEKQYNEAIAAFSKAVVLKPNDSEYILQLVSTKFLLAHHLDQSDKLLLKQLLQQSPQNINAINLMGLSAYQEGDYQQAIHYWESLLTYFPPASEDAKVLLAMIRQAQQHGNIASDHKVTVTVEVAAKFRKLLTHNESLFVYALDAEGSKVPLAVVRAGTEQLPTKLILDDAHSMLPGRSLNNAKQIVINARISKSGNASPSKGDLFGKSEIIKNLSDHPSVIVIINETVS